MRISFSPQRRDDPLVLEKTSGDRLRINGELFNFDPVKEGDELSADKIPCNLITGIVTRKDGEIYLTLILPHGPNPPHSVSFPEPIHVTEDGPITLPTDEVNNVDA